MTITNISPVTWHTITTDTILDPIGLTFDPIFNPISGSFYSICSSFDPVSSSVDPIIVVELGVRGFRRVFSSGLPRQIALVEEVSKENEVAEVHDERERNIFIRLGAR